jgi:hypothetical protein
MALLPYMVNSALGAGKAPIPAKLVKRIVSYEFIEMSELLIKSRKFGRTTIGTASIYL